MIATLLSGRLTFALGVAIGLAALVALDSERPLLSVPLAAATSFASPVAGFFLLLIGGTLALVGDRRKGAILGIAAALPIALMAVAFPTSGPEPFVLSSLLGTLAVTLFVSSPCPARSACCAAAPPLRRRRPRRLRGPQRDRRQRRAAQQPGAAPVLALGLAGPRRRLLLALCALPLLYWQWQGAVRDVSRAIADPAAQRSYYTPLISTLREQTDGGAGPDRDPADPGSLGGLLHGPEVPPRPRLGAPARIRRKLQLFRSDLTPAGYRTWLQAQRRQLRRPARTRPPSTTSPAARRRWSPAACPT